MKKIGVIFLFFILIRPLSFGQSNFHFSISPRLAISFGELNEILYNNDNTIRSQLDWEQKPILDLGLEASANYKNFIISTAFDYSLPLGTSYMHDSDWKGEEKYSYTTHPITTSKNLNTELSIAYQIKATNIIAVMPELQFNYIYSEFEADKGSGTYYGKDIRVYGIDYTRYSFFIFSGIIVKTELSPKLILNTAFYTAPWGYQKSYDYHHGKKNPFSVIQTQNSFFTKYKFNLSTELFLNKKFSIDIFTKLLFGFPDKGIFYSDQYSSSMEKSTSQKSGSNINFIKLGTALKISL